MFGSFDIVVKTGKKGSYPVIVLHCPLNDGSTYDIEIFIPFEKRSVIDLISNLQKGVK